MRPDILVIRYKSQLKLSHVFDTEFRQWGICTYNSEHDEVVVNPCSKSVATREIRRHGLVRVLSNSDGVVYDTPERDFQRLHNKPRSIRDRSIE